MQVELVTEEDFARLVRECFNERKEQAESSAAASSTWRRSPSGLGLL